VCVCAYRIQYRSEATATTRLTKIPSQKNMSTTSRLSAALVIALVSSLVLVTESRWTRREDEKKQPDDNSQMMVKMMAAVESGIKFFSQDYSAVNVDGLFGLRLGQGQIVKAIEECKSSRSCPASLRRRLAAVDVEIDKIGDVAAGYVKESDPDYFNRFIKTVNSSYLLGYKPRTLTNLHLTPAGTDSDYDEETGDRCFARLMGTFEEENNKKIGRCNVTSHCINYMTEEGHAKYSVTHQFLYFLMTEKEGCMDEVQSSLGSLKISDIEARHCGSIYNEALDETKDGDVKVMHQDLFLEQVLLCGAVGFENFLRSDWMKMVLSWQRPSGCFTINDEKLIEIERLMQEEKEEERKLFKDLQTEAKKIDEQESNHRQASWTGRKLLREQVMSDGCLAHKSGLGFGVLGLFARYLVRVNYLNQ